MAFNLNATATLESQAINVTVAPAAPGSTQLPNSMTATSVGSTLSTISSLLNNLTSTSTSTTTRSQTPTLESTATESHPKWTSTSTERVAANISSNSSISEWTSGNMSSTIVSTQETGGDGPASFFFKSILLPFGLVFLFCVVAGIVLLVIRKKRLEKLRHHLMPVYNFDPSEDGEDWETELLDENLVSSPGFGGNSVPGSLGLGGLKLDTGLTGGLNIKSPNGNSISSNGTLRGLGSPSSPTPSSGLLASGCAGNGSGTGVNRQLYTSEKLPVA